MDTTNRLTDDLRYLGGLLRKSERGTSPLIIYLLWAGMVLVGFSMVDFAPRQVGVFWFIGGPLGGVVSAFLGQRHALKIGQVSREEGNRHGWHWFGLMLAVTLVVPLGVTGGVDWRVFSRVFLLVVGLAYFLAGVHLERPLKWVGLLMMAVYVALFFVPVYGWTLVGVLVAAGLIASGLLGRRSGGAAVR